MRGGSGAVLEIVTVEFGFGVENKARVKNGFKFLCLGNCKDEASSVERAWLAASKPWEEIGEVTTKCSLHIQEEMLSGRRE